MDLDDERRQPVRQMVIGENLTALSVAELELRIATLQKEIERVRTELAAKRAHGDAAASLFKK